MFLLKGLVILIAAERIYSYRNTYRINARVYGGTINEDIVVDAANKLVTVTVGKVSEIDTDCPSTINLHDFGKGKLAIKNVDSGECLITETTETLDETLDLLLNITSFNVKHEIKDEILVRTSAITSEEDIVSIAGQNIADFCHGYKVFRGHPVPQKVKRSVRQQKCRAFCVFCRVMSDDSTGGNS